MFLFSGLFSCSNPSGGGELPDLWDGSIDDVFAGGDGGAGNPYRISTGAQLAHLAGKVNGGENYTGEFFLLTRDLDLDGENNEWTAIGKDFSTYVFKGNFNGDGHVIYNLFIDKDDTDYQGLFGYFQGAKIKNLGLVDVNITGKNNVGGIAGINSGSIENCYSTGTVSGTGRVGGIAGDNWGNITDCYNTGTINGTDWGVGGIAGSTDGGGIENSYNAGDISGTADVGGIAGIIDDEGYIKGCYNTGDASGTNAVGGIAGGVFQSNAGNGNTIDHCYSTGVVSGTNGVGGIAGVAAGNHAKIDHSYSTGAVGGTGRTGGIAGEVQGNSSVKNCAALNFSVTATTDAGRVAGYISGTNTFSGNVAWEEMTVTTGSGEDGANITKAQVQNGSLLPDSLKTTPWSYTMGKLPTLIGLAGQSGALPVYLW